MKIPLNPSNGKGGLRAMTLAEMLISSSIFLLLLAAFIAVHIFGIKQNELVNSLLGVNDMSRLNFNLVLDEIRASKNIQIGNGTYANFVPVTNGPQQGGSLQIIPGTNLNQSIYYWFDTNQNTLFRATVSNNIVNGMTNGATVMTNLVAQYLTNMTSQWLTNSMMFCAMDYTGTNVLTNSPLNLGTYNYNYSVAILLQFAPSQYPRVAGTNYLYDYYQLTFSATRRNP